MERDAALANITCSSPKGGAGATSSFNGLYRLSCRQTTEMWFDVIEQYGDLGTFLSVISLTSIVMYFVTSSDSGSLVIDCLSAIHPDPEPPVIQRIFWALTEGATATALLNAGGRDGLVALQTMSVASGVPYTILLCFMCVALWRAVKMEAGDLDPNGPQFTTSLLEVLSNPTLKSVGGVLFAIIAPWYAMGNAAHKIDRQHGKGWYMTIMAVLFYLWIILMALEPVVDSISNVAWDILMGFFAYATSIRYSIREEYNIYGNPVEDFFAVMIVYPFAAYQMEHHMDSAHKLDTPLNDAGKLSDREGEKRGPADDVGAPQYNYAMERFPVSR